LAIGSRPGSGGFGLAVFSFARHRAILRAVAIQHSTCKQQREQNQKRDEKENHAGFCR